MSVRVCNSTTVRDHLAKPCICDYAGESNSATTHVRLCRQESATPWPCLCDYANKSVQLHGHTCTIIPLQTNVVGRQLCVLIMTTSTTKKIQCAIHSAVAQSIAFSPTPPFLPARLVDKEIHSH